MKDVDAVAIGNTEHEQRPVYFYKFLRSKKRIHTEQIGSHRYVMDLFVDIRREYQCPGHAELRYLNHFLPTPHPGDIALAPLSISREGPNYEGSLQNGAPQGHGSAVPITPIEAKLMGKVWWRLRTDICSGD